MKSISELLIFCKKVQKKIIKQKYQYCKELLESNEGTNKQKWRKFTDHFQEQWRNGYGEPLSAEILFFPTKDSKHLLALTFWENNQYTKIWENVPDVKFYGYWDNTDPDENCSE